MLSRSASQDQQTSRIRNSLVQSVDRATKICEDFFTYLTLSGPTRFSSSFRPLSSAAVHSARISFFCSTHGREDKGEKFPPQNLFFSLKEFTIREAGLVGMRGRAAGAAKIVPTREAAELAPRIGNQFHGRAAFLFRTSYDHFAVKEEEQGQQFRAWVKSKSETLTKTFFRDDALYADKSSSYLLSTNWSVVKSQYRRNVPQSTSCLI